MRSKRRHKLVLTYKDSKQLLCPECTNSIFSGGVKNVSKPISKKAKYKALCKSPKCFVHKGSGNSEKRSDDRPIGIGLLQKITSGGKFRVKEFEEHKRHQIEINPAMLTFVEGLMVEINWDDIKFENVLGQSFIKEAITRTVIWPLNKPRVFKGLRAAPKGILLFGPHGVGKSVMGKHIAFHTNASFFNLPASVFTSRWADSNKDFVRALFLVAKARQPSVIFIDEIETLLSHRALYENETIRKIKNELFCCMDTADRSSEDRILIIGATKKPFDLDDEIIGRFSKRFYISLPDRGARKILLENLLERECHSLEHSDIEDIANKTEGYTAGEIKSLSQEAAMSPMMSLPAEHFDNLELTAIKPISTEDFIFALRMVKPSISKDELQLYRNWDSEYGFGGQCARRLGSMDVIANETYDQSNYII